MSIHPSSQELFVTQEHPREERIDAPIPTDVIERLMAMPEFVRAYEPDGMAPNDFMASGQRSARSASSPRSAGN